MMSMPASQRQLPDARLTMCGTVDPMTAAELFNFMLSRAAELPPASASLP
jgi:hypothetical protein